MGRTRERSYEARFWPENPLAEHLRVWPFKTNRVCGEGLYGSYQKIPSGVTLRYVVSGSWTLRLRGRSFNFGSGGVFCTVPSESAEFKQTDPSASWEWLELQFSGPTAEAFLESFGLGPGRPLLQPATPQRVRRLFLALHETIEAERRRPAKMLSLAFALLDLCGGPCEDSPPDPSSRAGLVRLAKQILESERSLEGNVEKLSARLGVERTTLYRAFKEELGLSPHEYIGKLRLLRAEELLAGSLTQVGVVASLCGFPDVKYFIGWFKAKRGLPPGAWRAAFRSGKL